MARLRARRMAGVMGLASLGFVGILVVRAATSRSRQPVVPPLPPAVVDEAKVSGHLGALVRRLTISTSLDSPAPAAELDALHADLATFYPKVHATLIREIVGGRSLLFTWRGSDPSKKPIILCAHMDVVPVEVGTEAGWTHPPFAGAVENGFVWGRGTLDDKGSIVGILEAIEALLAEGFVPARTVYLAFGQDEEISGRAGAVKIAETLAARGVHAELALDEGSALVENVVTDVPAPVAAIGIAEKGYVSIDLKADLPGGHSSTPSRENALTVLARAVQKLQEQPMPARLDGATEQFFAWAAPEMAFGGKLALTNLWVTGPLVRWKLSSSATLGAAIRTTTAVTVFHAGVKDNVVPATATATVNFRVLPGDTTEDVLIHVRRTVDDARVVAEAQAGSRAEPSKVSGVETRGFRLLAETTREVFPGTVVAPSLVLGATDGRWYSAVADDVYRFLPFRLGPDDITRIHGKDERVGGSTLAEGVRFYRRFVAKAAGGPGAGARH